MSLDSTEEEQIDQIKQFFRENGLFMLIAVILVVGGNIGYDYYETSERTAAEAASLDFSNFQKAVDEVVATGSGREDALAMGEAIKADHPGTAYAALGACNWHGFILMTKRMRRQKLNCPLLLIQTVV